MKKIILWLTVMVLGLCLGCTEPEPAVRINLKFRQGQMVDLKIGGRGQIINVDAIGSGMMPYRVRIQTDEGPKYMWFDEFELEITPWEPS